MFWHSKWWVVFKPSMMIEKNLWNSFQRLYHWTIGRCSNEFFSLPSIISSRRDMKNGRNIRKIDIIPQRMSPFLQWKLCYQYTLQSKKLSISGFWDNVRLFWGVWDPQLLHVQKSPNLFNTQSMLMFEFHELPSSSNRISLIGGHFLKKL